MVALSTFEYHFPDSPLPSVPAPHGSSCIKRKVVDLPAPYGDFVVPSFPIDMTISDVANSSMNWIAKKVPFPSLARFVSIYLSLCFPHLSPGTS